MAPPGRRQVERCVRCARPLTKSSTVQLAARVDERHVTTPRGDQPAPASRAYELAAVCREQALDCTVSGERCESIGCIDCGCLAEDVEGGKERGA